MIIASPHDKMFGLRQDEGLREGLLEQLPETRGKMIPFAPLAATTWFRVGGPAEVLFKPADEEDLIYFLAHCPKDIPITILGIASNTLIRDGGIPGIVIKLGPSFASIKREGNALTAGAATVDLNIARAAQAAGLAGLEFLSGIPGTLGGGLRMNAGAYGRELKDVVTSVTAIDRTGQKHLLTNAEMQFAYRHCGIDKNLIFTEATLEGDLGDPTIIAARIKEIQESRAASQPIREMTGGSTFANPEGHKAWQLIDEAGCRGLRMGGAMISDKHCNFLINTGQATADDIERLGEEVRRRVLEKSGIELRWEIRRIGVPKSESEALP